MAVSKTCKESGRMRIVSPFSDGILRTRFWKDAVALQYSDGMLRAFRKDALVLQFSDSMLRTLFERVPCFYLFRTVC